MNKKLSEIQNILGELVKNQLFVFEDVEVAGATTNIQMSEEDSIGFYHLGDTQKQEELFQTRLESCRAKTLVLSRMPSFKIQKNILIIEHKDFIEAQKRIADQLYPIPSKLKFVGITGTNGKTTTVSLISQLLESYRKSVFTIGTIGICLNGRVAEDLGSTSPSYMDLRRLISTYGIQADYCVMEVSSHALVQNRLNDVQLDVIGWTSFSQDHLDYHRDMEDYFNAKMRIFEKSKSDKIIISEDESELAKRIGKVETVNLSRLTSVDQTLFGQGYNKSNMDVALGIVRSLGYDIFESDFSNIRPPAGRFYTIEVGDGLAVVDYAHTPDAILNVTKEIKNLYPSYQLVTIFGCGGDRDRKKRPLMAKAAQEYSDQVILTSDNPRTEPSMQILEDAQKGFSKDNFKVIEDRREAIVTALELTKDKVVVLIAGKGHETYQEINNVKHPFDDQKIVEEYAGKL